MKDIFTKIIDEFSETASFLNSRGWTEAYAGNISYNITDKIANVRNVFSVIGNLKFWNKHTDIANNLILLTGTGTRMKDIQEKPEENLCLLRISKDGKSGEIMNFNSNKEKEIMPTSELASHLEIYNILAKKEDSKAILHAHPTEVIAISHLKKFRTSMSINSLIKDMLPEIKMMIPGGVGLIPYREPGSIPLAELTAKEFRTRNAVIWEKHGALSTGRNLTEALNLIDVIVKALKIYFLLK